MRSYLMSTSIVFFFLYCSARHRALHSFPTRRSSDLAPLAVAELRAATGQHERVARGRSFDQPAARRVRRRCGRAALHQPARSEEHTSELQSPDHLVCRLLLEKKKQQYIRNLLT